MSTKELKSVHKFIIQQGACYESDVFKQFCRGDDPSEMFRVSNALSNLSAKGFIFYKTDRETKSLIVDNNKIYGS